MIPEVLKKILIIALIIFAAQILMNISEKILEGKQKRRFPGLTDAKSQTVTGLLQSVVRVLIIFFALNFILQTLGINTDSVIAAAGVGGVAIAFGAQAIIADVISGVFLLLDGTIEVGDYVEIGGFSGTVRSITLRKTVLSNYSGALMYIPNAEIKHVANYQKRNIRSDITVSVPYTVTLEDIQDMITQAAAKLKQEDSDLFVEGPSLIGVQDIGDFTYKVLIGAESRTGDQWQAQRLLRKLFLEEMEGRTYDRQISGTGCRNVKEGSPLRREPLEDSSNRR